MQLNFVQLKTSKQISSLTAYWANDDGNENCKHENYLFTFNIPTTFEKCLKNFYNVVLFIKFRNLGMA